MGFLGWTEQETLDTSIPAILMGLEARMDMLKLCFGSGEEPGGGNLPPTVTPEKVDSLLEMLAG